MNIERIYAVNVLVHNPKDPHLILAVSRKNDPTDFGLPGGKRDPGEHPRTTAAREALEETGITVRLTDYPVLMMDCGGKPVVTYLATAFTGEPKQMEAGLVKWVSWDTVIHGCFGEYNRRLYETVVGGGS